VAATLELLGYKTGLRRVAMRDGYFPKVLDEKTRAQAGMFGWIGSTGSPPSYVLPYFTCRSIRLAEQNNDPSFLCAPRVDTQIARALRIQARNPDAAIEPWVRIERELVDLSAWVPLYIPRIADFVSRRVGNYQFSPTWLVLLDQLWVR
jgi:peptide/nickel transport system substrate-binding protein